MRSTFYSFLFLLLFPAALAAQTHIVETIKTQLGHTNAASEKLDLIFRLCENRQSISGDTLYYYASMAKRLTSENSELSFLADYYKNTALENMSLLDSGLRMTNQELDPLKKLYPTSSVYRKFLYLKGTLLVRKSFYKEGIAQFYNLLQQAETYKDEFLQIAAINGIGWAYMEMGQPATALKWFYKAIDRAQNKIYNKYYATLYSNLGSVYASLDQLDSAEYYVNCAIDTARNYEVLSCLANALNIQANIYTFTNRIPEAEQPLYEALNIRMKIGDPFYIVSDMLQLALYYASQKQEAKGIELIQKAIQIAKEKKLIAKLPILYRGLAECYKAAGDQKNYSETLEKFIVFKDSMYEKNTAEALADLNVKYEVQKKENTIIQQKLQITRKNFMFYGSLALLVMLIIIVRLVFKNYSRKNKMKLLLLQEEDKRKELLAVKDAEEKERKRIAADLHDNLGSFVASIKANTDEMMKTHIISTTHLELLQNNTQQMISLLDDTIWALRKESLKLSDISDRIKTFLNRLKPNYPNISLRTDEQLEPDFELQPVYAYHLLMIIQEAITNAVHHSEGNEVTVKIDSSKKDFISITDNGKGIQNNTKNATRGGSGRSNMQLRAAQIGCEIVWENNFPQGTVVVVRNEMHE